jgi:hypothetical protein
VATKKNMTTNFSSSFVAFVGSGIRDPGSEIQDPRSGIQDPGCYPGSATPMVIGP